MTALIDFTTVEDRQSAVVLYKGENIAPDFNSREFWGGKDPRNKTGNQHELCVQTIQAVQAVRTWAYQVDRSARVIITSTYRTVTYNKDVLKAKSGSNSPHSKLIAIDFKFADGINPSNSAELNETLIAEYNTQIRDKGNLYRIIRALGVNGFGLYGSTASRGMFIHLDARNIKDHPERHYTDRSKVHEDRDAQDYGYGSDYCIWTRDNPQFVDERSEQERPPVYQTDKGLEASTSTEEFIEYVIKPSDPNTLELLCQEQHFPGKDISPEELSAVKRDGISNDRIIYDATSKAQQIELYGGTYKRELRTTLPTGTVINIPVLKVKPVNSDSGASSPYEFDSDFLDISKTPEVESWPYVFKRITNDPGFIPAYRSRSVTAQQIFHQKTIWVWSRVRYLEGVNNGWINISKDVSVVTTTEGETNVFRLQLADHNVKRIENDDPEQKWESLGEAAAGVYQSNITKQRTFSRSAEGIDAVERVSQMFFYEMIIQPGDLVFISFEKLTLDAESTIPDYLPAGKWCDFIGRVDQVVPNKVMQSGEVTTDIEGRDLSSILMDDLAYFIPYTTIKSSGLGDSIDQSGRLITGAAARFATAISRRTIKDQFLAVFHYLSSIDYIPEGVLSGFQNLTETSLYKQTGGEEETKKVRGLYKLIKVFIDPSIKDLHLVDDSLTNPQASVFELLKGACQEPFVQFLPMTIGDKYFLIARKAPYDYNSYKKLVLKAEADYDHGGADGPLIDHSTGGGVRGAYKSLLDKLGKRSEDKDITQEPGNVIEAAEIVDYEYPLIINIDSKDVQAEFFRFDDRSYAWFEVVSQGTVVGKTIDRTGIYPVAYFNEIAEVFGNKKMSVTTNYADWTYNQDSDSEKNTASFLKNVNSLLMWLIETHIYLPFTRTGTITINGDRRIRKGMFIFYRPTREVFYVTNVQHEATTQRDITSRTTIIEVERGMKIDYIQPGVNGISYFNILKTEKLKERIEKGFGITVPDSEDKGTAAAFTGSYINTEVLEFFLRRRQFGEYS